MSETCDRADFRCSRQPLTPGPAWWLAMGRGDRSAALQAGLPVLAGQVRLLAPGSGPALAGPQAPGRRPESRCLSRLGGSVIIRAQPSPVGPR